ncbi:MAG: hypothetical protein ACOYMG_15735 [Candidatus Methylumidiphilus sp.]
MSPIIENLRLFNSKERYFLVNYATKGGFALSDKFCDEVNNELNLKLPESPFVAMDYHLDWILASLELAQPQHHGWQEIQPNFSNHSQDVKATQEDSDFIIAFENGADTHIVLLEVKGVIGWTNKQLQSKAERLAQIFGKDGKRWPRVVPHFATASPKKSKGLIIDKLPTWMKPDGNLAWIKLPETEGLWMVSRCDDGGSKTKEGKRWTIAKR